MIVHVVLKCFLFYLGPEKLSEGEVLIKSFHEKAGKVVMYFNVELELALVAIHKSKSRTTPGVLSPNSKKL